MNGHPLFKDDFTFSLVNDSRIKMDQADQLTNLNGRLWINNLVSLIGKNATGKTTTMRLLIGILLFLLHNQSIDQTPLQDVLLGEKVNFIVYLYGSDKQIYQDQLSLALNKKKQKWYVVGEKIYCKKAYANLAKKDYLNFDENAQLLYDRQQLDSEMSSILADDDSLFRVIINNRDYEVPEVISTLRFTNLNALVYPGGAVPETLLNFLDPTIEYLKVNERSLDEHNHQFFYRLKFKNNPQEFTDANFATIEQYLSSGTAKGITLYSNVIYALQTGGLLFIDELENHFNHVIVRSFIEYFTDPEINKNRATLIFSTHYSELLSDLNRGDEIYIVKRDPLIELQRYSQTNVRQDLNRTEVYNADLIGGTAPKYESYMNLKKAIKKAVKLNEE